MNGERTTSPRRRLRVERLGLAAWITSTGQILERSESQESPLPAVTSLESWGTAVSACAATGASSTAASVPVKIQPFQEFDPPPEVCTARIPRSSIPARAAPHAKSRTRTRKKSQERSSLTTAETAE
jgi:hypothetical protein